MNFLHISLARSVLIFCHMSYVEAECCGIFGSGTFWGSCNEGGWCCGCGSCNIFCCNCANGCDRQFYRNEYKSNCGHKRREIVNNSRNVSLKARLLFKKVDIDGNNAITMGEVNSYFTNNTRFKKSTTSSIDHEVRKMDTNRDGIISPKEFDSSLTF